MAGYAVTDSTEVFSSDGGGSVCDAVAVPSTALRLRPRSKKICGRTSRAAVSRLTPSVCTASVWYAALGRSAKRYGYAAETGTGRPEPADFSAKRAITRYSSGRRPTPCSHAGYPPPSQKEHSLCTAKRNNTLFSFTIV